MFKWDGTDITDIISQSNIYEAVYSKHKYWVINVPSDDNLKTTDVCMVRSSKGTLPSLVDELKSVFGLQKIGTHWCKYKGKILTLIKCIKTNEGYVKEEITLDKVEHITQLLKMQVQEIFAFRELLGITRSYDSSIIIRETKNIYPISFYEPNMLTVDTKIIPITVLDKWFGDTSIDEVVMRLCKIRSVDKLGKVLYDLRNKIEDVINRTDRRNITYKDCIVDRITERLQTTLDIL